MAVERKRSAAKKGSLQEVSFPRVKREDKLLPSYTHPSQSLPLSLILSLCLSVSHGLPPPTKRQPTQGTRGEEREKAGRGSRVLPPAFAPIAAAPREIRSACAADAAAAEIEVSSPALGCTEELLICIPDPIGVD